ncbi:MAG: alpha/beta fold hydrolase [Candidatus Lokiarchaeota archaeon]|nr:alpha/beta fold hydrolase [Candidatus Harpocratesius repetitus]
MYFERLRFVAIATLCSLMFWILTLIFAKWITCLFATIVFLSSIASFGLFLWNYFTMMDGDWANLVDLDALNIKTEKILIPMTDEVHLSGLLLMLKHSARKSQEKLPVIIMHHGVLGKKERNFSLAAPLAAAGYAVLLVDARGHGETLKNYPAFHSDDWYITESTGIFPDFSRIVDYVCNISEIDNNRIAAIGTSMGGGLVLTQGLKDERIRMVIALSPYFSWKTFQNTPESHKIFTEPWVIRLFINSQIKVKKITSFDPLISPQAFFTSENSKKYKDKIRIVHARNDNVLLYEAHFLPLQARLKLLPENVLILNEGDHYLRGQETIVLTKILHWIKEKL